MFAYTLDNLAVAVRSMYGQYGIALFDPSTISRRLEVRVLVGRRPVWAQGRQYLELEGMSYALGFVTHSVIFSHETS